MTRDNKLHIDIVSMEKAIFSGRVKHVIAMTESGEVGIMPGHTPLLAKLKAGDVHVATDESDLIFYLSGGMLEVQPDSVTVLADTAIRSSDLDEAAALAARERAEKLLSDKKSEIDFTKANIELAEAMAQLRAISKLREQAKH